MNPFMVIHYAAGPETHDVWSRNGIISLGGPNLDASFYNGRRPYRWDVFPSGSEGADEIAEYYCKKMAAGNATNAGSLIHVSIGGRNTPRKLGVIIPDNGNGASTPNAARVQVSGREVQRQGRARVHLPVRHQPGGGADPGDGGWPHQRQGHHRGVHVRRHRPCVPHQRHDPEQLLPRAPAAGGQPAGLRRARPPVRPAPVGPRLRAQPAHHAGAARTGRRRQDLAGGGEQGPALRQLRAASPATGR